MKRLICSAICAVAVLCSGHMGMAQHISPVHTTFTGGGKGDLAVSNNTMKPMIVTMSVEGFGVGEKGKPGSAALDPRIHIKFSKTSVRLNPQQTYHIFYDASADSYPAWCYLIATFSPIEPPEGRAIVVKTQLAHALYMYQKEPMGSNDVTVKEVAYDPETHMMRYVIDNHSNKIGRPRITFPMLRDDANFAVSVPLFPNRVTTVEQNMPPGLLTMFRKQVPKEIAFQFEHSRIQMPLTEKSIAPHTIPDTVNSPAPATASSPAPASTASSYASPKK
ncbi:MAG: hypothetical protein FWD64_03425 [Acidobacteriaceae bacterium]|nr:hypothetical protein [Acidobacteriaceae bacterium]